MGASSRVILIRWRYGSVAEFSHLVVGPDERILVALQGGASHDDAKKIARSLTRVLGPNRSLVLVGDMEIKVVEMSDDT
jgi:hypothetical protein